MSLTLAYPPSVWPSQVSGGILINVPVTCAGPAATAVVKLYVFEGSIWATHGTLLDEYTQQVAFLEGQTVDVVFSHTLRATSESRRDVGIEVIIDDKVVASAEFDDVFSTGTSEAGMDMSGMMGMVVILMMMGMVVPMVSGEEMEVI